MAKIVVIKGGNAGREFTLTKVKFKIGRGKDNDLLLTEPAVSRNHAEIKYRNGKYFLTNFGRNGTKVDSELVKSVHLKDGDEIEIESTIIRYREEPKRSENCRETVRKKNRKLVLVSAFLGTIILISLFVFLLRERKVGVTRLKPKAYRNGVIEKTNNPGDCFKLARRLYREREIKEENLFLAIQSWQKGLEMLGTSSFPETVVAELKVATDELDRKIKDEMFGAYQSYHLDNLTDCRLHLERVLKLIPSPDDKRYQSALTKLKALNQK